MTDSDPPGTSDASRSRLGRLFAFGRRSAEPAETPPSLNGHTAHPSQMRLRIAEFEQAAVSDVMIPRADIVARDVSTTLGETLHIVAAEAHSRLPVYRESLDEPVGFVHIKDVVSELASGRPHEDRVLDRIKRDILFVPPSMPLANLMIKMQASRIHLALVVDEYGGTDGLVSLEDLMEEIVGNIEDEHDEDAPKIVRRGRNLIEADARMEVDDFQEATGLDLTLRDVEYEVDTLGGIAFALAGRIPVRGEVLRHPNGVEIEIMDGDTRRIRRLRLRASPPALQQSSDAS